MSVVVGLLVERIVFLFSLVVVVVYIFPYLFDFLYFVVGVKGSMTTCVTLKVLAGAHLGQKFRLEAATVSHLIWTKPLFILH